MDALGAGFIENADHPSIDELLAYRAGKIDDERNRTKLQEHLAWCPECSRTLLADLAAWPEIELDDPNLARTDEEEAEDWQAIRRRLGHENDVSAPTSSNKAVPFQPQTDLPIPKPPSARSQRPYGAVHLLAAALLLAVVGLSVQVAKFSREPMKPRANVFVIDLEPAGDATTRTQTSESQATRVPAGMDTIVFLLVQKDLRPFDDHAIELRGVRGEILWQSAGLVSSPEGGFSVALPRSIVPVGGFEMRLYGVNGSERELLAVYRTRVELPDMG